MLQIKIASKLYCRADLPQEAARLQQDNKHFTKSLRILLEFGLVELALERALKYEKDHQELDKDVSPQQIAYMILKQKSRKGADEQILKEALSFVENPILRIQHWKDVGNYSEAVHELVQNEQLDEAYKLMLTKCMYKEGMKIAMEHGAAVKEAEFFLNQIQVADHELNEETIKEKLGKLEKSGHGPTKALAFLMHAKLFKDLTACNRALAEFDMMSSPGALEAFNQLQHATKKRVEVVIHWRSVAQNLVDSLLIDKELRTPTDDYNVNKVLKFYSIDKDNESGVYTHMGRIVSLVPVLAEKFKQSNSGLEEKIVLQALADHFNKYSTEWFDLDEVMAEVNSRLERFDFHKEVLAGKFTKSRHNLNRRILDEYIDLLIIVVQACNIDSRAADCTKLIVNFLSPLSSYFFILQWRHIYKLRRSKDFKAMVEKHRQSIFSVSEKLTIDDLFIAWRLSCIAEGNHRGLQNHLAKLVAEGKVDTPFINVGHRQHFHIFHWWLRSCTLILQGRVRKAISLAYDRFFAKIAASTHILGGVSVMNITSIFTVYSTALTYMLSTVCNQIFGRYVVVLPIPQMFENNAVRIFDKLNASGFENNPNWVLKVANKEITGVFQGQQSWHRNWQARLDACLESVAGMLMHLLNFLLGRHIPECNVLKKALSSQESLDNGAALHCLVLTLVMAANLFSVYTVLEENTKVGIAQACLLNIQRELHTFRHRSPVEMQPSFANYAYFALQKARNLGDIFKTVGGLLMNFGHNNALCIIQDGYTFHGVRMQTVEQTSFSTTKIKSLVIMESQDESKPDVIVRASYSSREVVVVADSESHIITTQQPSEAIDTADQESIASQQPLVERQESSGDPQVEREKESLLKELADIRPEESTSCHLLSKYKAVDEKFCGICGIELSSEEEIALLDEQYDDRRDTVEENVPASSPVSESLLIHSSTVEQHVQSTEHMMNEIYLEEFEEKRDEHNENVRVVNDRMTALKAFDNRQGQTDACIIRCEEQLQRIQKTIDDFRSKYKWNEGIAIFDKHRLDVTQFQEELEKVLKEEQSLASRTREDMDDEVSPRELDTPHQPKRKWRGSRSTKKKSKQQ